MRGHGSLAGHGLNLRSAPSANASLDGRTMPDRPRGSVHFYRLTARMRTSHPDETQLMFLAFDLLHLDSVDLRGLPPIRA